MLHSSILCSYMMATKPKERCHIMVHDYRGNYWLRILVKYGRADL